MIALIRMLLVALMVGMTSSWRGGFLRDDTTGALIVQGTADRDNGQPGIIAPSGGGGIGGGTAPFTASRAYFCRFVPSRRMVITKIAFVISVASATDDQFDVGIYDATGAKIQTMGALTSVSGSVSGGGMNSIGLKVVTLTTPVTVEPSTVYYAALGYGTSAGPATFAQIQMGHFSAAVMFGTGVPNQENFTIDAAFPLPNTITGTASTSSPPKLALRES